MSVLNRFVHDSGRSGADALVEVGALLQVQIEVPPVLAQSFEKAGRPIPAPISGVALIDTGATRTAVDLRVQKALEIQAVGKVGIATAGGRRQMPRFPGSRSLAGPELPTGPLTRC